MGGLAVLVVIDTGIATSPWTRIGEALRWQPTPRARIATPFLSPPRLTVFTGNPRLARELQRLVFHLHVLLFLLATHASRANCNISALSPSVSARLATHASRANCNVSPAMPAYIEQFWQPTPRARIATNIGEPAFDAHSAGNPRLARELQRLSMHFTLFGFGRGDPEYHDPSRNVHFS